MGPERRKNLRQVFEPTKMGFWYMNGGKGRWRPERASTMWKDERTWGFPGLDVCVFPSILFSARFPGQVHRYPLLQLPEASNKTGIFLAPVSFLSLRLLDSIFNRMSQSPQGSNYPKLHSPSLLPYTSSWWVGPEADHSPCITTSSQQPAHVDASC